MKEAIKCYLVKPSGRSHFWKMRYQKPGDTKETQKSLKVRDERAAQRLMSNFIIEMEREAVGIIPSRKLREAATATLESSLRSYLQDLQAQKCCAEHVSTQGLWVRKIAREIGWQSIRDVDAGSFVKWRAKQKTAAKTQNHHLAAVRAFLNWLVRTGSLPESPLCGVQKVKEHEKRRPRRAITDEEVTRLLAIAPPERRIIYLMALHSGLRRNEMELLEWQDVFLDAESPFIKLRVLTTKNRKGDEVSIHPELKAELLKMRDASTSPTSRVVTMFSKLRPFMRDLAAAGIPYIDERGLRFDLHAMRMTFNTRMANGNVPTRVAMHAMRHSEERLTTGVYTDASRLPVAAHVASLPSFMVSARASGKSDPEGNTVPLVDTTRRLNLDSEPQGIQQLSHTLTQAGTLCLSWGNGSGARDLYYRTYVKFDLTRVSPGAINTAELKMKVSSLETGGNNNVVFMRLNDDSWSESGITWNNAPVPDPVWITQRWNQAVVGSDMTVNVKDFVTTEMNGNKTISFVLADTFMQTKAVRFHSREAAAQANRPRLVINGTTYYATEDANVRWGTYANTNYPTTTELAVKDEWGNTADTGNGGMEIDVMESLGIWGADSTAHAMHWDGYGAGHKTTGSGILRYPPTSDEFHVYGLYWQEGLLEFYVDGVKTYEWKNSRVMSVPAYLILSLQAGGWDGNTAGSQMHNQTMEVDWVRAWSGVRSDVPVVNVSGNGLPIPIGSSTTDTANHTKFGLAWVGEEAVTRTYTISNTGDAPLILDPATISGTNAADFTVSAQPAGPVAGGGSTTFTVSFSPSVSGLRSAVVSIGNNDDDKTPYTFAIDGKGEIGAPPGEGTHGTWTNLSGGAWSTAGNWSGTPGVIADGTDSIASFNALDVTTPVAVTLDSTRRIGGLVFGDTTFTNSTTNTTTRDSKWILSHGGNPDRILTLAISSGRPAVTVVNMGTYVLNHTTAPRSVEIGTTLTGTQGLTKNGPGALLLTGEGGFEGGLHVEDGSMILSNTQTFSGGIQVSGAATRLEFGSDSNLGNVTSIINAVTLTGGATLHRSGDSGGVVGSATPLNLGSGGGTITYSGYTAATLGFSLAGHGTFDLAAGNKGITLSGDNSAHSGGFNINSGNLYFKEVRALPPTGSILVNGNGALGGGGAYDSIQGWLDSGRIDTNSTGQIQLLNRGGTGSNENNLETIDMTGHNNLFLGVSDVVNLGTGNILKFSGTITPAGNTYRLSGGRGATLALVNANILTGTNNLVIGNGSFGGTAVNLNASNNFTGTTTAATNNTVNVAAANALGSGVVNMLGSSSLRLSGGIALGNALTLNGVPSDANTGALHNSGGANLWTGAITLDGNSRIAAANTAGSSLTLGNIHLGTRTLSFIAGGGTGGDIAVTGAITGSAGITKTNTAGTLTLAATNSDWSGNLSLQGGTLAIGNHASLGSSGTLTIGNSATIRSTDATARTISNLLGTFAGTTATYTFGAASGGTGNITFSNTASASLGTTARTFAVHNTTRFNGGFTGSGGSISKTGNGTMILNGTSTFSGGTTVSSGTLGGTGTIGATLVLADATIAPGDAGIGTLHTGALAVAGTLAVEINGSNGDRLMSTGAVDLAGATLTLAELGPFIGPYVIAQGASLTGTMTVPARYAVDVSNGTQAVLTKPGGSADFAGWASANGVTGGPGGDSDHDGIPNAIEYALHLDAAGSDGTPGLVSGDVVTFHKRAATSGNSDLAYRIEVSADLGVSDPWSEVAAYLQNDSVVISATIPSGSPANFARLRVIVTP